MASARTLALPVCSATMWECSCSAAWGRKVLPSPSRGLRWDWKPRSLAISEKYESTALMMQTDKATGQSASAKERGEASSAALEVSPTHQENHLKVQQGGPGPPHFAELVSAPELSIPHGLANQTVSPRLLSKMVVKNSNVACAVLSVCLVHPHRGAQSPDVHRIDGR